MISVSVIIPTLGKRPEMLEETLESIRQQTVQPIDVIIESEPGIEDPDNIAIKLNNGIKKSKGDAFVCLADDDKLMPNFIEKMSSEMESGNYDIVSGLVQNFGEENGVHTSAKFPMACTLWRKSVWENVGGYSMGLGPEIDIDFAYTALKNGAKWKKIPDILHMFRVHKNQLSQTTDWDKFNKKFKDKWGDINI